MSRTAVADLVDRYLNDTEFRAAFARDPEAAVREAGFALDAEDFEALHAAVWTHADEALQARVSRYTFGS